MKIKTILVLLAFFCLPLVASAAQLDVNNFSYDPAPAQAGKQLTLWVNLRNNSNGEAQNVAAEIIPEYPFSILPGERAAISVGTLGAYNSRLLTFKLLIDQAVVDGTYTVKLKLSDDSEGIKTTLMNVRIVVKNPKVELVRVLETRAVPGQDLPLELKLRNIGGATAKNIVLKIKEDRTVTTTGVVVDREIFPLGASAAFLEFLKPNDEATVRILLGVNKTAQLRNYSLPVTIEFYDDNGTMFSSTGYLGIKVAADPELDAVINSISPLAFPGGTSELTVNVFNVGAAGASYVVAELGLDGTEFSESKLFVGTLDPDDFDSFKVNAKFSSQLKTGTQELKLKLSYKDGNNETKTIEKSLPLKVVTAAEAQAAAGTSGNAVLGIIGLLLQLLGLFVLAKWLYPKAAKLLKR